MYNINNKLDNITIRSKHLKKIENIIDFIPTLDKLINRLKEEKPLSIRDNISSYVLKINYGDVLQYYYNMIKYLEISDKKRFQLLPQLSLKLSYVKFDSRMISTIYEKYNSDGIIKNFEKHYEEYYKKCF